MGELSKLVGEVGESLVFKFLERIGWTNGIKNQDFDCNNKLRHNNRKTHGIDYIKSYMCPLIQERLVHALVSIKFSSNPYPKYPNSDLKDFILDLSETVHCYDRSKLKMDITENINRPSGFDREDLNGVVFWLTNNRESYDDLISETYNARFDEEVDLQFDALYVVDNRRVEFIWNILNHADINFPAWDFLYINTGFNYSQNLKDYSGKLLPIEYINSSIIPIRQTDEAKDRLVVYVLDEFDEGDLKKVIGTAMSLCNAFASEIYIAFPNYNKIEHGNSVNKAVNFFSDDKISKKIHVINYNNNLIQ